jgi:hypothetical protein
MKQRGFCRQSFPEYAKFLVSPINDFIFMSSPHDHIDCEILSQAYHHSLSISLILQVNLLEEEEQTNRKGGLVLLDVVELAFRGSRSLGSSVRQTQSLPITKSSGTFLYPVVIYLISDRRSQLFTYSVDLPFLVLVLSYYFIT